eukprot:1239845-Pyramimonas_sp.AAC.1
MTPDVPAPVQRPTDLNAEARKISLRRHHRVRYRHKHVMPPNPHWKVKGGSGQRRRCRRYQILSSLSPRCACSLSSQGRPCGVSTVRISAQHLLGWCEQGTCCQPVA